MSSQRDISAHEVGKRLRRLREPESQLEFGARFGIKQAALSTYELGKCPLPLAAAVRIADGTATNLSWLLFGEGRQPLDPPTELTRPVEVRPADESQAMLAVKDRRLAEMLAALADEFEELNERGREALLIRFWDAHPDLRQRSEDGQGRRVAGLAAAGNEPARRSA